MTKEIQKWWDETTGSYQVSSEIHTKSAHYGPYAPDEAELNLLGNVKGKRVLEIGCGGGQCSIAFAKKGAICTGIDISKGQLKYAEKLAKENKVKINFVRGSFQDLSQFKSKSFNIVFSAYALQYSPDLNKVFRQVNRILKKDGLFVFSFDHPFYLLINPISKKLMNSYFDTGRHELVETWQDKTKHKFIFYRVKISDIYNALIDSGFFVEKIIEPLSLNKKQIAWTRGSWKKIYPKETVKLIGPTIIFKSKKLKEFAAPSIKSG